VDFLDKIVFVDACKMSHLDRHPNNYNS